MMVRKDQIRPRTFQRDTEEINSPNNDGATRVQNRNVLEENKIHGLGEGQGGEGKVEPAQPDCGQSYDDPHCSGEASGGQESQPRPTSADIGHGEGTETGERHDTQADLTAIPSQEHKRENDERNRDAMTHCCNVCP